MSILPNLVDVCENKGLMQDYRTSGKREVRFVCPFCNVDTDKTGRKRKYHLSVNAEKNAFKCWYCGESGGVLRFLSLLENTSEKEILTRLKEEKGVTKKEGNSRRLHPAEFLSVSQLRLIKLNPDTYKAFINISCSSPARKYALDLVWERWNAYLDMERRWAYRELLIGLKCNRYTDVAESIRNRGKRLRHERLLDEVLTAHKSEVLPEWAEDAHVLAEAILN